MANAHTQDQGAARGLALDWRSARLEQLLHRASNLLGRIPGRLWRLLAILVLVLWLSHSLARLFWLVMPVPVVPGATVSANALASDRAPVASRPVDIDALRGLQVFGRVDEAALAADAAAQEPEPPSLNQIEDQAVDTQLRLVLRGVIASTDEDAGRAIIADGNRQAIYSPGDKLPGGNNITLAKVLERRIILDNNGRYESLWLYPNNPAARRAAAAQRRSEPEPVLGSRSWEGDEQELYDTPAPESTEAPEPMDDQSASTLVEVPPEVVSAAAGQSLADVVSMSVYREGGNIVGYRIRPGRNADLFHALGLMPDDVVTAVNGTPLDSAGRIMEIQRNMAEASSASLEIRRGGESLSIEIVLD